MRVGAIVGLVNGKAVLLSNIDEEIGSQKLVYKQIVSSGLAPDGSQLEKVWFLEPTKRKVFSAPSEAVEVEATAAKPKRKKAS